METSKCTLSKFSVWSLGFAFGIAYGVFVLALGVAALVFGWGSAAVSTVGSVYVGFAATPLGLLIGALWGFVDGFIFGVITALVYNFCLRQCHCNQCKDVEKVETKV